jgi:hypothetical protein
MNDMAHYLKIPFGEKPIGVTVNTNAVLIHNIVRDEMDS